MSNRVKGYRGDTRPHFDVLGRSIEKRVTKNGQELKHGTLTVQKSETSDLCCGHTTEIMMNIND